MRDRRVSGEAQQASFARFVSASHASLLRTAWLLTADRGLAEDLVQTALTATFLTWQSVEAPEAYARTVLMRDAVRGRRRRQLEQLTDEVPDRAAVASTEDAADVAEVRNALDALPVAQRAVLVLRYWHGLDEREIAKMLGCRPGTVKSRANRAVSALRASGLLGQISDRERELR